MARKFYKTSVIRYRGFGFREHRAPRGFALSTSQLGSNCAQPIGADSFVIHGSLATLRTVLTWWLLTPQTAKVGLLDVAFFI